jgi:hypothetical protein
VHPVINLLLFLSTIIRPATLQSLAQLTSAFSWTHVFCTRTLRQAFAFNLLALNLGSEVKNSWPSRSSYILTRLLSSRNRDTDSVRNNSPAISLCNHFTGNSLADSLQSTLLCLTITSVCKLDPVLYRFYKPLQLTSSACSSSASSSPSPRSPYPPSWPVLLLTASIKPAVLPSYAMQPLA